MSYRIQGRFPDGYLGLHSAGHFAVGGDLGDIYSSPADPVFYLHHAMLDRVFWLWQALHPEQADTVAGTVTFKNKPPGRATTLKDLLQLKWLDVADTPIEKVMNTLGGTPLCYIYN